MTAFSKFIIGSILSFFGSLSNGAPMEKLQEDLQVNLQMKEPAYVFHFPAKEDCEKEKDFTFTMNNFKRNY